MSDCDNFPYIKDTILFKDKKLIKDNINAILLVINMCIKYNIPIILETGGDFNYEYSLINSLIIK